MSRPRVWRAVWLLRDRLIGEEDREVRETVMPYGINPVPPNNSEVALNAYCATEHPEILFNENEAEAHFDGVSHSFFLKKKAPDAEINIRHLGEKAKKLFLGPGGSDEKEWLAILNSGAVRVQ